MLFTSTSNERLQFENALTNLINTPGLSKTAVGNAQLTQSYLRSIVPLVAGQNQIQFQILANQNNTGIAIRPDERRLNQQDAFYCSKLWVYIFVASSATAYNYVPQTFPDSVLFPTGGAQLPTLYNGFLSININQNLIVPYYPMSKFLWIPQTQQTAATNSPVTQFDGSNVMPFEPNVVFPGVFQTTLNITMPAGLSAVDNFSYAMLYCEGVLAQNVALGAVS